jgi:hypothetical protein
MVFSCILLYKAWDKMVYENFGQIKVCATSRATKVGHYSWYSFSFFSQPITKIPEGVVVGLLTHKNIRIPTPQKVWTPPLKSSPGAQLLGIL